MFALRVVVTFRVPVAEYREDPYALEARLAHQIAVVLNVPPHQFCLRCQCTTALADVEVMIFGPHFLSDALSAVLPPKPRGAAREEAGLPELAADGSEEAADPPAGFPPRDDVADLWDELETAVEEEELENAVSCKLIDVLTVPRDLAGPALLSIDSVPEREVECSWCHNLIVDWQVYGHKQSICPKRQVDCPLGCGFPLLADELEDHLACACPKRLITCRWGCGETIMAELQQDHEERLCPKRVVTCICGMEMLAEEKPRHEAKLCSLRVIHCNWCGLPLQAWTLPKHKFTCTRAKGMVTELHGACWANKHDEVKRLLEDNGNLESQDGRGNYPIHVAACIDDATLVDFLLNAKSSVHARDKAGQTPLMRAAARGSAEAAQVLVHARSDLGAQDREGLTALALATFASSERIQKMIFRAAAYRDTSGDNFQSAVGIGRFIYDELAMQRSKHEIKKEPVTVVAEVKEQPTINIPPRENSDTD
jgi:hypothetical protein